MRRLIGPNVGRLKADDGYTLTEMLVVIGIIALIAAVLTPSLIGQMGRARYKTAQMQLDTIAAAVEAYRSDMGAYPDTNQGLAVLVNPPAGAAEWQGPYLKNDRYLNDPWGTPVVYARPATDPLTFTVTSWGADGAASPGVTTGNGRDLQAP